MQPADGYPPRSLWDNREPPWVEPSMGRAAPVVRQAMQAKLDTFDNGFDQNRRSTELAATPLSAQPAGSLGPATTDPMVTLLSRNDGVTQGTYTSQGLSQPDPVTPSSHLSPATSSWGGSQVGRSRSRTPATSHTPSRSSVPLRFACPYFHKDREKYDKTCSGRGWSKISRLKEHLYKFHSQTNHCARCQKRFESSAQVWNHQRQSEPCVLEPCGSIEAITPPQEKELKSRKRNQFKTDVAEWNHIYKSLFPREQHIPRPYRDDNSYCNILDEDENTSNLPWDVFSPLEILIDPPEAPSSHPNAPQEGIDLTMFEDNQLFNHEAGYDLYS